MANNRIYWAIEGVGVAPSDSTSYVDIHGLQSIGITTTFNLEQIFEIGQLAIYENIEDLPDIEVTLEKVLDGYPLIYHLATRGSTSSSLAGRSNAKCMVAMSLYGDTQESASGTPVAQVQMSGMYVSSLTYTMPVDGNATESITLVGNNKIWLSDNYTYTPDFQNTDTPAALAGSGGVQRRENVLMDSLTDDTVSLLPGGAGGVEGISSSGTNDKDANGQYGAHLQSITVSTDLGRDNLNELGRKGPYFRYVNFPVEVTCEIETISTQGDQVEATEEGVAGGGENLFAQRILVVMEEGTKLDLGSQNKLANVTYGGADAGGGNATTTYSYTTFNDLTVTHPVDPG